MMDPRYIGPPQRLLQARLLELERERWRRVCRGNLLAFAIEALSPRGMKPATHHELFCAEIEAVTRGQVPKLILIAPRGSAKTTYVSHLTPAQFFAAHPNSNIIAVSHTVELAESNSAAVQRFIREHSATLGYDLVNDARGRWTTTNGCTYLAAGVGQAIRGFRADLILVDDPIRSRAEGESEVARNSLWEFVHSDLLPCLKPRGGVVLIATAYHEMDLMMRLEREHSDLWRVVRLPALSEGDGDPLGRAEGAPLWADDPVFGYAQRLLELRAEYEQHGRLRDWYSQYQGRPRPPEGAMFKPARMPVFDAVPPGARVLEQARGWDLASSAGRGDWTVGLKLARLWGDPRYEDMYLITDVQRIRGTPDEVRHLVRTVAEADGYLAKQWFPRDPGQAGVDQAESYVQMLSGCRVEAVRQTGDKATRADAAASQANIGQIGMLRADWNAPLIDELGAFPSGVHDDIVDALSLVFNQMASNNALSVWMRL
jgi:predicted phage terminase large subunit-like protein